MKTLALLTIATLLLIPACATPPKIPATCELPETCEFHKKNPNTSVVKAMLGEACVNGDRAACGLLAEMNDAN